MCVNSSASVQIIPSSDVISKSYRNTIIFCVILLIENENRSVGFCSSSTYNYEIICRTLLYLITSHNFPVLALVNVISLAFGRFEAACYPFN